MQLHTITSNRLDLHSVKEDVENFIIVHSYDLPILVLNHPSTRQYYDVYVKAGMDDEEFSEYDSSNDMEFNVIECRMFQEALDMIGQKIIEITQSLEESPYLDFEDEDTMIAVISDQNFSKLVCSYMNKLFRSSDADLETSLECFNFYQHLKTTSFDSMVNFFKGTLGLDMVYPDDPIAFAFVCKTALNGG